jgi:hypothetical protein
MREVPSAAGQTDAGGDAPGLVITGRWSRAVIANAVHPTSRVDRAKGTNGMDAHDELTPEQASRLTVTAVTADLEYWARTASVDGRVGLNDLIRALDVIRQAGTPDVAW